MHTLHTEVAIIGGGTAGMGACRASLAHTDQVLMIEGGPWGTTCARVGCMPSKLLIAAAEAAHHIQAAPQFGVHGGVLRVDGRAVMARVRSERDRFVGFVQDTVEGWTPRHTLRGFARFIDDHTLEVRDAAAEPVRVVAQRIVIATGSTPDVPPAWRAALGARLIVNDDVFDWTELPRSVAVVGAGVIGLELAQALHRLGVRVRLYARSQRVGPLTDPGLQKLTLELMSQALPLTANAGTLEVALEGDAVRVRCRAADGSAQDDHFELLLCATGRRPHVQGLGLEQTTLPLDPDGMPIHDSRSTQIGQHPVFLAGDVANERPLLHEAADEGRIAGDNAGRFPQVRLQARRSPLSVVFSDPQIMLAGASYAALKASGAAFETGSLSFADQGRSRVMGVNRGALHVYGERGTDRFLGAEMIGPAAEHIGHLLAWSVQRGDTVAQMLDCPFYHPVIEEGLRSALRELQRALRLGPVPVPRCLDCGPGG